MTMRILNYSVITANSPTTLEAEVTKAIKAGVGLHLQGGVSITFDPRMNQMVYIQAIIEEDYED